MLEHGLFSTAGRPKGAGEAAVTLTGDLLLSQRPQIECSVVENCKGMGRDGKSVVRSALN